MKKHIIGLLVKNEPGVLNRVSGLFSRRGYNIESISVGVTTDPNISRMTITLEGDDQVLEQVIKQLNKQIDVLKVSELKEGFVERELALLKVKADDRETRSDIMQIADVFRANVVDVSKKNVIIEVTGDQGKINAIIEMLKEHGIKELAQTGIVAMNRGKKSIDNEEE